MCNRLEIYIKVCCQSCVLCSLLRSRSGQSVAWLRPESLRRTQNALHAKETMCCGCAVLRNTAGTGGFVPSPLTVLVSWPVTKAARKVPGNVLRLQVYKRILYLCSCHVCTDSGAYFKRMQQKRCLHMLDWWRSNRFAEFSWDGKRYPQVRNFVSLTFYSCSETVFFVCVSTMQCVSVWQAQSTAARISWFVFKKKPCLVIAPWKELNVAIT